MISFKKLLLEGNQSVSDLLDELNSGKWIIPQKDGVDLYRGEPHSKKGYKIKPERQNRDPRDTSKFIHSLVDVVGRNEYEYIPLRSKSYFGATRIQGAEPYGALHYAFPKKDSKVVSFQGDTIGYFRYTDFGKFARKFEVVKDYISAEESPETPVKEEKLTKLVNENLGGEGYGETVVAYGQMAGRGWALGIHDLYKEDYTLNEQVEMVEEAKNYFESTDSDNIKDWNGEKGNFDTKFVSQIHRLFKYLYGSLYYILEYFEGAEKGIEDDSLEVMLGGSVLVAKKDFVDKNVEFNNSSNKWIKN